MIVKKTKQLGNFKKGINLYVPTRRRVSAAPSGIPVASTNTINVVDTFGYNGTIALSKISSTLYAVSTNFIYGSTYCEAYSDYVNVYIAQIRLIKEGDYWIYRYEGIYNCEENYSQNSDISSVLEVTNGIIPTTGWSPAITITAA
jgi:hypothetical protein